MSPMSEGSSLHLVVITGMSGAGRSSALRVLEDLGYFCVDNLPPALAPSLVALVSSGGNNDGELRRIGFGIDVRTGSFLNGAGSVLDGLAEAGHETEVIFLDCSDEVLVRRFSESRRPHPLASGGDVIAGIRAERERLGPLRMRSRHVIDTSTASVHDLRRSLIDYIARGGTRPKMAVRIVSFGFKYGIPVDADLVFDLRFLPNPYHDAELRPLSGLDGRVSKYVLASEPGQELAHDLRTLLEHTLPRYQAEGKAYLTVALGCTGGRHRSVAFAEHLGQWIQDLGRDVVVAHRDVDRA